MFADVMPAIQTAVTAAMGTGQTPEQYAAFYKGTPYESGLNKFLTYTPPSYADENGNIQTPGSWGWTGEGETGAKNYIQQQNAFTTLQAKNPTAINYMDKSKYGTASDLAAAVSQAQYDNWKSQYYPAMLAARDMTTYANPGIINTEVAKGVTAADQASDNAAGQQSRAFQRFGMSTTAEQQAAIEQSTTQNKALSEVDASNRVRMGLSDRNKAIMAGSGTSFTAKI